MAKEIRFTQITNAVKKLRQALRETQEAFAQRLGTAKSSLVRYESTRAPRGAVLAQLAAIAEEHGEHECARVFRRALAQEVGEQLQPKIDWRTNEEREYVLALLAVLRNSEIYENELPRIKALLDKARRENERQLEEFQTAEGVKRAMFKLLDEGKTVVYIADLLGIHVTTVEKAAAQKKFWKEAYEAGLFKPEREKPESQVEVVPLRAGEITPEIVKAVKRTRTTLPLDQLKTMPRRCEICENVCDAGVEVCPKCRTRLSEFSLPIDESGASPKPKRERKK